MNYTQDMNMVATYWQTDSSDLYGQPNLFGVLPERVLCRWQDSSVLFRDSNGQERTSTAIVYPEKPLAIKSYIALGDYTNDLESDPRRIEGAYEIQQVQKSPSLDGSQTLTKVFL